MSKEEITKILEDYEFFVDDDWGGHYEHINCSQRALTPLGIVEILDYITNLEQQNKKCQEIIGKVENLKQENKELKNINEKLLLALESAENRIDKAKEYIYSHLKQEMSSDFTGANYIQEYITDPDNLLDILAGRLK